MLKSNSNLATILAIIAILVGIVALVLPGPVGPQGIQGVSIQGMQGIQGIPGVGIQGIQGPPGEGTQGIQGIPGVGIEGPPGPPGESIKGDKGDKGDYGPIKYIEINSQASTSLRPTTYTPARNANVTLYGSGYQGDVIIWLLDSGGIQFDLGSVTTSNYVFQVTVKIPSSAKVGLGAIVTLCGGIPSSSIAVIIQ